MVPITDIQFMFLAARVALLRAEVIQRNSELAAARLESANRLAAMRAALAADHDGETDPLEYLRDEIGNYPRSNRGRP